MVIVSVYMQCIELHVEDFLKGYLKMKWKWCGCKWNRKNNKEKKSCGRYVVHIHSVCRYTMYVCMNVCRYVCVCVCTYVCTVYVGIPRVCEDIYSIATAHVHVQQCCM